MSIYPCIYGCMYSNESTNVPKAQGIENRKITDPLSPMKTLLLLAFLGASAINTVSGSGDCLKTTTSTRCVADDGGDCRWIKQSKPAANCGRKSITISSQWCNFTGKDRTIYEDQGPALKLTGPAVASLNDGKALTFSANGLGRVLRNGKCDKEQWEADIDTCKPFFNYEVNIFASKKNKNKQCRGYNYARQMKSICKLQSNIGCMVMDGKNGGKGTPCEEVQRCTIVEEDLVNGVSRRCTCPECIQDVRYEFEYTNPNNQLLRLDPEIVTTSNAKIRWQTVQDNRDYFREDVPAKNTQRFSITESKVDVCNIIPAASLSLVGNIIDPKTNEIDEDIRYCTKYDVFSRIKFSPGLSNCLDAEPF
eukprot:945314_1